MIRISHDAAGQIVKAYESKLRDLDADFIVIQDSQGLMSAALIGIRLDLPVFSVRFSPDDRNIFWVCAPPNLTGTALLVDDFVASGQKMHLAKKFLEAQGLDVKSFSMFFDSDTSEFIPDVSQGLRDAVIFDWLSGPPAKRLELPGGDVGLRYGAEIDGVIVPLLSATLAGIDQRDFLNRRDSQHPVALDDSFGCSLFAIRVLAVVAPPPAYVETFVSIC